ncbi:hypothetical protein CANARDRAFT_179029, partial [[Candida] arabinofermentans NRRL YB-2248]
PLQQLTDLNDSKTSQQARLSVTKIIPGNWCELQRFFRLYNNLTEEEENRFMIRGKVEHAKYELITHASVSLLTELVALLKKQSKSSHNSRVLAAVWSRSILRLTELFEFGEAREILVHGVYNMSTEQLLNPANVANEELETYTKNSSNLLVISGVIDHLVLESGKFEGVFDQYQQELEQSITNKQDLSEIIKNPLLYMSVRDLKTRSGRSLPHPFTQNTSKIQIGMYRKFLEDLSISPEKTYRMMLINSVQRNVDIDEPLSPELVIYLMLNNKYLINDFKRLKNGDPIGFQPFDNDINSPRDGSMKYSIAPICEVSGIDAPELIELVKTEIPAELHSGTLWKTAPTYRYLAARLAQLYGLTNDFLSPSLSVEYSAKDTIFNQVNYRYNKSEIESTIEKGMDLWNGRRLPLRPQYKTICKSCEFSKQCGWYLD